LKHPPSGYTNEQYEHARKRIIFSSVDEVDSAVSEANRVKKAHFKDYCNFEDWVAQMESRKKENSRVKKNKKQFLS